MPLPAGGARHAVTDQTWTQDVLLSDVPVLVDFTAQWCPPCRKLSPMLAELAAEFSGRLRIAELDIDTSPLASRDYGVMSAPTLMLFRGGEPVQSIVGLRPKSALAAWIEAGLQHRSW